MVSRRFIPGSEWLFLKIYTGEKTGDDLLATSVFSLVSLLHKEKFIDRWFFIRYEDNIGFHLRLRFHLTDVSHIGKVIERIALILNHSIASGLVNKIMYDVYVREIERYGESTYGFTEEIFHVDSDCMLNLLAEKILNVENRWEYAFPFLDDILTSFGFSLAEKHSIVLQCRDCYREEFGFVGMSKVRQLNEKYRKDRAVVIKRMGRDMPNRILEILDIRKIRLLQLAAKTKNALQVDYRSYVSSLMHMSVNRLFMSDNRLCEMIIYDYLTRYYESLMARIKYNR